MIRAPCTRFRQPPPAQEQSKGGRGGEYPKGAGARPVGWVFLSVYFQRLQITLTRACALVGVAIRNIALVDTVRLVPVAHLARSHAFKLWARRWELLAIALVRRAVPVWSGMRLTVADVRHSYVVGVDTRNWVSRPCRSCKASATRGME